MWNRRKNQQERRSENNLPVPVQEASTSSLPVPIQEALTTSLVDKVGVIKYPHPKILLVDMQPDAQTALKHAGYNVKTGSFGTPYRTNIDDICEPIILNHNLPNYSEQEIVVIDVMADDPITHPEPNVARTAGTMQFWVPCNTGIVDPRPLSMHIAKEAFSRIYSYGGIFVIFAGDREEQEYIYGHQTYRHLEIDHSLKFDNWCFLPFTNRAALEIKFEQGHEISINEEVSQSSLIRLLREYFKDASFGCTINPSTLSRRWVTLATNKYGAPVSGIILPHDNSGLVIVLPRVKEKGRMLLDLINEVLPDLAPRLFPHAEGANWIRRPEYELPKILQLKSEIELLEEETRSKLRKLELSVEAERRYSGFLYDLITETGDRLVSSVKQTLELIGFKDIIDVDAEIEQSGGARDKREDLRIKDTSPIVLVEVKGIGGLPTEENALQVSKYIAPRMKEWQQFDIRGLSIINHQRHLPALERQNTSPFQVDVLTNAQKQEFGLLTTWDLFRLARNYQKHRWTHENVKDLFYQSGRIIPIPSHYEFIGVVENYYERANAVSIEMQFGELSLGDRIAFEFPIEFEEQDIQSLRLENNPVEIAKAPNFVGTVTHLTKQQVKKGVQVYRVKTST